MEMYLHSIVTTAIKLSLLQDVKMVLEKEPFTCKGPSLENRGSSSSSSELMFKLKPLQRRKMKEACLFSQIHIFVLTASHYCFGKTIITIFTKCKKSIKKTQYDETK